MLLWVLIKSMIDFLTPTRLPLPPGMIAGFTTRKGGMSAGEFEALNLGYSVGDDREHVVVNRTKLFRQILVDETELAIAQQTHSANVAMVQEPGEFVNTDALITHEPGIFISVQTADCLPILVWTADGEWMGAIHSGWRGTEQGIVTDTLALLLSASGYEASEHFVWIGPGLGQCHFEVGPEFEIKFDSKYLEQRDDKIYFDNLQAVMDQIERFGIPPENIESVADCTYCNPEKYFSHRRDAGKTGRMMAIIGRHT